MKTMRLRFADGLAVIVGAAIFLAIAAGASAPVGAADLPWTPVDGWVVNGSVNAIVRTADTTYLGGAFTMIGPNRPNGVPLDATSGQPVAPYPRPNGTVRCAAPDGAGGWYIGGDFTRIGAVDRNRLAHIKPDGTVDAAWNPNADNTVRALAVSGMTVYAGGDFTTVGGTTRNRLAAIGTDGTLAAWDPNAGGTVSALAVSGTTVYAGGSFTTIGGTTRNRLAAIGTDGTLATWDPNVGGTVSALAVSGTTVYVGGAFTTVGGTGRGNLAAIGTNGTLGSWRPTVNGSVFALAVSGTTVYVGGLFNGIGRVTRNNLAAISTTATGPWWMPTAWDPNVGGWVGALAVSGTTVYAGGDFTTVGGTGRNRLAAIGTTGTLAAWDPNAGGTVYALAVSGTTVYAGGAFTTVGGTARNRLAAIGTDGTLAAWNPNADNTVSALAVSGTTVYAGGSFTTVGGTTRNRLAAIGTDGTLAAWDPNADNTVSALAVSGTTVYAGGAFTTVGGTTRNRLAAIGTDGTLAAWDPNAGDTVSALVVSGTAVYAGGDFTTIGGTTRNRLAAIGTDGTLDAGWNPNADGTVNALAVSDTTVYAGGAFTTVGGTTRNRLAAIGTDGTLAAWDPNAGGSVSALAVSGTTVYAGGMFVTLGGYPVGYFAQLGASSAATTTTLSSSLNPSTYGVSVTFTATVSPSAATDTVTFKDGGTTLGTGTLSGGAATLSTGGLTVGGHTVTAEYGGDAGYSASTGSPLSQTVNKANPQSGPWSDPATWGGTLPGAGEDVVIPAGIIVTLDVDSPAIRNLTLAGTLVLSGVTLDAVSVTVGADATLGGTGTVSAPVSLAGTVSPGVGAASTVGTLTFTDTLTFSSGSRYLCHAATATDVDLLAVTGAVTGTAELTCTRTGTAAPAHRTVIAGGTGSSYSLVTALDPELWQLLASGNDLRLWYGPPLTLAARQETDSGFGNGGAALLGSAGTGQGDGARAIALGAGGRLLTAGRAAVGAKGGGVFSVSCFLADGTPDPDFGGRGTVQTAVGSDSEAFAVVVQADGKIVAAGRARNAQGDDDVALVRYHPDGTLDTSFGTGGIVTTDLSGSTDVAYALVLQGWDQRLIAAGVRYNGAHYDLAATRYTNTGSVDSTYGSAGTAVVSLGSEDVDDAAFAAALQKDGMLVLAGQTMSGVRQLVAVVRLDPTGALDPGFGSAGAVTLAAGTGDAGAAAVAVQPDGRILVAGSAYSTATGWDLLAARWLSAGGADASFGPWTGPMTGLVLLDVGDAQADDYAFGLALQPDGRIVLAGSTTVATPTPAHTVMLLTGLLADGDLDLNFGQVLVAPGAAGGNAAAYAVALAPGGKVVAAGTASNGTDTDTAVVQLQGAAWEVRAAHGTGVGEVWTAIPDGYIESRTAGLTCVAVRLDLAVDPASVSTGSLAIADHLSNSFTASAVTLADDQRTLIFTFAALPNARRYTFTLAQTVTAASGLPLAAVQSLSLGVLAGDADGDGDVDEADLLAIRACSSLIAPAALARYDLNSDGRINVGDLLAARTRLGVETLP